MNSIALFVQRCEDGHETTDTLPMRIIECVTCDWFLTYLDVLWTSNRMPEQQKSAFLNVQAHARKAHRGRGRIIQGWKA